MRPPSKWPTWPSSLLFHNMSLKQTYDVDDVDFGELWDKMKRVGFKLWSRTTRRVRFVTALFSFL